MGKILKEGDIVTKIFIDNDNSLSSGGDFHHGVIVMEYGQMAGVPWVNLYDYNDKLICKYNAALLLGIVLK